MNCKRAQEAISRFLDEQLDPTAQSDLNRHLERCNDCSAYLDDLREGLTALRSMPLVEPSPNFEWNLKRRLQDAIAEERVLERHRRPIRFWSPFAISAAAALLLSLGSASVWYATLDGGSPARLQTEEFRSSRSDINPWARPNSGTGLGASNPGVVPVGDSPHAPAPGTRMTSTIQMADPGVEVKLLRRSSAGDSLVDGAAHP